MQVQQVRQVLGSVPFDSIRAQVEELGLEVTDDVSIIEQLGLPVKLTLGEYTNLKLTTPEDMIVAANILTRRAEVAGERGA